MNCMEIIIGFEKIGVDSRLHEIELEMYQRLKDKFASTVIIEELKYNQAIDEIPIVRISVILCNKYPIDIKNVKKVFNGLIDDYEEYSNLIIEIV